MDNYKPILAIETSADLCSICLYTDEGAYAEENVMGKQIHSEKIFSIIDNVCKITDVPRTGIKSVAISVGPGSFTGLRIGMAAAKGIATGMNLPIIPVPSFDAWANKLSSFCLSGNSFIIASSVNRDELYFSRYIKTDDSLECVQEPVLIEEDEYSAKIFENDIIFGNYNKNVYQGYFLSALDIARWANNFGNDLLTYTYDFLEPNYLKNFVAKVKK